MIISNRIKIINPKKKEKKFPMCPRYVLAVSSIFLYPLNWTPHVACPCRILAIFVSVSVFLPCPKGYPFKTEVLELLREKLFKTKEFTERKG